MYLNSNQRLDDLKFPDVHEIPCNAEDLPGRFIPRESLGSQTILALSDVQSFIHP